MANHDFYSLHTHSRFSANDAMPHVAPMVAEASALGYRALGLTDHGSPSGNVQLYQACRKAGIEPLPGLELYTTTDYEAGQRKNMHLTVAAYTTTGYRNLCRLATLTAQRFHYKPRVDFVDLADLAANGYTDGLVVSTGCYFGAVVQTLLNVGFHQAAQIVQTLAGWFPRCYVELQNHGIYDEAKGQVDDEIVEALVELANHTGVPYIVTQDSHYLTLGDKPLHDAFKRIVSFGEDPDDAIFPGDGYQMVDTSYLRRYFDPAVLGPALDNLADLADAASVRIPELDDFILKVPDVTLSGEPQKELEERISAALVARGLGPRYIDRANEELGVIETAGMAGYLLLVAAVCDFMRANDIWFHARGSASGSLVTMLLGITREDPVRWGLRFDRFLSADRTRPPDIDLDVEHTKRHLVEAWLAENFAILRVGTHMQYSMSDEDESGEELDGKGSLLRRYYTAARRKTGKSVEWKDVPYADREVLRKLSAMKLIGGYGKHAAGFVVAPDTEVLSQLPQAYIAGSSNSYISAYGKKDVDKLGFVKLDLLGLRDITAFRTACELAGVVPEEIPEGDKAVFRKIARGDTAGIFQLQGAAMAKGCERLKPRSVEDLAAAQALFRPATMHSGATTDFMARRHKTEPVPDHHADIEAETKDTFGVLLYQEQVIGVLRRMRMPADELTEMLDAVKASNEYVAGARVALEAAKPRIRQLAEARGWLDSDIDWLIDAIAAFADYSFNKAHAVAYGMVAYRSAWLSVHHPQAFWAGLLTAYLNHEKEPMHVRNARRAGIRILPPHVNRSKVSPTIDPSGRGIRRGLLSIKGIGETAATELAAKGPFTSLRDLGQRCIPKKVTGAKHLAVGKPVDECGGAVGALLEAGALDGLEP